MHDASRVWRVCLPWIAAAASGLALALSLPGLAWWPLGLVFPGLFLVTLESARTRASATLRGWFAGTVHWMAATSWVVAVMHDYGGLSWVVSVLCLALMALILGASWGVVALLVSLVRDRTRRLWLLPLVWTAVEAGRQLPPYLFPWNTTASALSGRPELLGSLPVWGATGLGWAYVTLGCGLWAVASATTRRVGAWLLATCVAMGLLATLWPSPCGEPETAITVAVIQPGTTLAEKWNPEMWPELLARVWKLTGDAGAAGAEVVLWPESAVPYRIESDEVFRSQVIELARATGVTVVLNAVGGNPEQGFTNSAYVVTSRGLGSRYDKVRLVPFGEYVPRWARLGFTQSLVKEVGSFTPGAGASPLDIGVPLGMSVCYEVAFADLVARQVRAGAEVLATITNDGWYGNSWAPRQHFAQAVLRAGESRRWMARAALTGISGLIDPNGKVVDALDLGRSGFAIASVVPCRAVTLRSKLGDWWGILCAAAAVAMFLWEVITRRRQV